MGFTEAELGFVIAALFAAIAVATLADRDAQATGVGTVREELERVKTELAHTNAELERTKAELARTKTERDALLAAQGKRSTKLPQCWEKGERSEPIAEIQVLGDNLYDLEGESVGIDGITNRFAADIAHAESLGCHYVLNARPSADVNAVDQSNAVWRLRRYFDVNDRPK